VLGLDYQMETMLVVVVVVVVAVIVGIRINQFVVVEHWLDLVLDQQLALLLLSLRTKPYLHIYALRIVVLNCS